MTVEELLNRMSSQELSEWMAYGRIEPFGPEMDLWRSGNIAAVIANVNRGKGTKPFKPADFIPKIRQQQSVEEMIAALKLLG